MLDPACSARALQDRASAQCAEHHAASDIALPIFRRSARVRRPETGLSLAPLYADHVRRRDPRRTEYGAGPSTVIRTGFALSTLGLVLSARSAERTPAVPDRPGCDRGSGLGLMVSQSHTRSPDRDERIARRPGEPASGRSGCRLASRWRGVCSRPSLASQPEKRGPAFPPKQQQTHRPEAPRSREYTLDDCADEPPALREEILASTPTRRTCP